MTGRYTRLVKLIGLLAVAIAVFAACDSGDVEIPPTPPGATGPCISKGGHCTNDGECCGTLSCDGAGSNKVCSDGGCMGEGSHCTSSSQCCGTLSCTSGFCRGGTSCSTLNQHCSRSSDCCGTLTCGTNGTCTDGVSCVGSNGHCTSSSQCCGALTCSSGLCR